MNNPFPKSNFFNTPDSPNALLQYIEQMSVSERNIGMLIAAMAMNLAHKMFEDATQEKE
jgi:hypothetical protein